VAEEFLSFGTVSWGEISQNPIKLAWHAGCVEVGYESTSAMKALRLGAKFTIFLLFFGVATLEAFQTRNWLKAGLWLAIGVVFLVAGNLHGHRVRD
jgi:hypothetical protein